MLFWDSLYSCTGTNLYETILSVFSDRCFTPAVVDALRPNLLKVFPIYHKYINEVPLTQKTCKFVLEEAIKTGVKKGKPDAEETLIFEAAFVVLLHFRPSVREKLVTDFGRFLEIYPEFKDNDDVSERELMRLLLFHNMMVVSLHIIPAKFKKTHLLDLVCRVSEGNQKKYVCGGGQSSNVDRRVLIYERTGGISKQKRAPRWNEIIASLSTAMMPGGGSGGGGGAGGSTSASATAKTNINNGATSRTNSGSSSNASAAVGGRKLSSSSTDSRNSSPMNAKMRKMNNHPVSSSRFSEELSLPEHGNMQVTTNEVRLRDYLTVRASSILQEQPYQSPSQGQGLGQMDTAAAADQSQDENSHSVVNATASHGFSGCSKGGFVEVLQHFVISDLSGHLLSQLAGRSNSSNNSSSHGNSHNGGRGSRNARVDHGHGHSHGYARREPSRPVLGREEEEAAEAAEEADMKELLSSFEPELGGIGGSFTLRDPDSGAAMLSPLPSTTETDSTRGGNAAVRVTSSEAGTGGAHNPNPNPNPNARMEMMQSTKEYNSDRDVMELLIESGVLHEDDNVIMTSNLNSSSMMMDTGGGGTTTSVNIPVSNANSEVGQQVFNSYYNNYNYNYSNSNASGGIPDGVDTDSMTEVSIVEYNETTISISKRRGSLYMRGGNNNSNNSSHPSGQVHSAAPSSPGGGAADVDTCIKHGLVSLGTSDDVTATTNVNVNVDVNVAASAPIAAGTTATATATDTVELDEFGIPLTADAMNVDAQFMSFPPEPLEAATGTETRTGTGTMGSAGTFYDSHSLIRHPTIQKLMGGSAGAGAGASSCSNSAGNSVNSSVNMGTGMRDGTRSFYIGNNFNSISGGGGGGRSMARMATAGSIAREAEEEEEEEGEEEQVQTQTQVAGVTRMLTNTHRSRIEEDALQAAAAAASSSSDMNQTPERMVTLTYNSLAQQLSDKQQARLPPRRGGSSNTAFSAATETGTADTGTGSNINNGDNLQQRDISSGGVTTTVDTNTGTFGASVANTNTATTTVLTGLTSLTSDSPSPTPGPAPAPPALGSMLKQDSLGSEFGALLDDIAQDIFVGLDDEE